MTELNRHATALAVALLLATPLVVCAQAERPPAKGTPKLQPRPSETSAVPAGVDAGTPATSKSVPLGTPTTPANEAEREELRRASAAARAAARRRAPAASAPLAKASAPAAKASASR